MHGVVGMPSLLRPVLLLQIIHLPMIKGLFIGLKCLELETCGCCARKVAGLQWVKHRHAIPMNYCGRRLMANIGDQWAR